MVIVARFEKIALDDHDQDLLVHAAKLVFHEVIKLDDPALQKAADYFQKQRF